MATIDENLSAASSAIADMLADPNVFAKYSALSELRDLVLSGLRATKDARLAGPVDLNQLSSYLVADPITKQIIAVKQADGSLVKTADQVALEAAQAADAQAAQDAAAAEQQAAIDAANAAAQDPVKSGGLLSKLFGP